jgi:hypothetical protein
VDCVTFRDSSGHDAQQPLETLHNVPMSDEQLTELIVLPVANPRRTQL